jgi:hypothetical protein
MLFQILKFELTYWLKQPMVYVFLVINALLIFGATSSDNITVGSSIGNVHKNSPYTVQNFYASMSIISMIMVTAFVNVAAARDFFYNSHQIIYSTSLRKFDFLAGRFIGASLVSMIPFLGVSIGNVVGAAMPWIDESRIGATNWNAHVLGFVVFVIPNVLFVSAFVFCIAALTRSTITSFIATILFLVAYGIAQSLVRNIEQESIGILIDPLGSRTFSVATKYWTVDDKNTLTLGLSGIMLTNRLIWLGAGALILVFTFFRFSFSEKLKAGRKKLTAGEESKTYKRPAVLPETRTEHGGWMEVRQLLHQTRIDYLGVLKSTPFIVILLAGILNMTVSLLYVKESFYGGTSFPVTYNIITTIQGTLYIFLIAIIAFYTGVLVWKERDARQDEIQDALPHPEWTVSLAKLAAMTLLVETILLIAVITGAVVQTVFGYHHYQPAQYFVSLMLLDGLFFFYLIVLSLLVHTLTNNKYMGYFIFIVLAIVNLFIWPTLNVSSNMVIYGGRPSFTYSDMNGYGPFVPGLFWFNLYWWLFAAMLSVITLLLWMRGKETSLRHRWKVVRSRFQAQYRWLLWSLLALWLPVAAFVFYNTKVLNTYVPPKTADRQRADYEKKYKTYEGHLQPRITDMMYHINLYPEQRRMEARGQWTLKNKSAEAIDSLFLVMPLYMTCEVTIPGANMVFDDQKLQFRIYRFARPMLPGDTLPITFTTRYDATGFENEVQFTQLVDDGSFFNNSDISPAIGYQPDLELLDKNKRIKHGLSQKERMPPLERNCTVHCMDHYVGGSADWIHEETIISTSAGQTAVAPGALVKEWKEDDRHYFHYNLDHPSLSFFSFISATYEVARETWNGVNLEVYYVKGHEYNVPKMLQAMRASLEYYSEHFGPYYHHEARVIEFPRYASFAQAFAGTMPYSESIGFIANLDDSDDIDMVTYVVAHEMGHQWWAHQVIGANMQGATLLTESMAQYSALMVMKKMYGEQKMHKFLKYEMDRYLRSRGGEILKEAPLLRVEHQGYVHYNKASVVMYYLQKMIGEEAVNAALRQMVDSFAYREPPYPTSWIHTDALAAKTPDSLKYLIRDLFYDITLFNNKTEDATYTERSDGSYEVTLKVRSEKLKADSSGRETRIPEDDWIEIGAFAKPAEGKKYGEQIYSRWEKMTGQEQIFTFVTRVKPDKAGIDPNYYLVDRIPDDNLKTVTEK